MKILATTAALLLLTWSFSASSDSGVEKTIGDDWRWFEDYALFYGTYVVVCEPGRLCEVGMGIKTNGKPRGEKIRFRGEKQIKVVGIGAIHIRVVDGKGPSTATMKPKELVGFGVSFNLF